MLTTNHQDWREANRPPVMHSILESRQVKRERYTFMNSESHNGIYHAEESVRYNGTDTTRDALDLRLGKADESSQYFAETNLLSDGPTESPLDALPDVSRRDTETEHRDRNYDIEDVDSRLRAADQGTSSYEYIRSESSRNVYHDAQALKDDRKRRSRVVSEGAVSLAHTATRPLPIEKSNRQRSVSMPHPHHNQRRNGGYLNIHPESGVYGDRDDLLTRSVSNRELDANINELRATGLPEATAHSSGHQYIQVNPRLRLDDRRNHLESKSIIEPNRGLDAESFDNIRANSSSQAQHSLSSVNITSERDIHSNSGRLRLSPVPEHRSVRYHRGFNPNAIQSERNGRHDDTARSLLELAEQQENADRNDRITRESSRNLDENRYRLLRDQPFSTPLSVNISDSAAIEERKRLLNSSNPELALGLNEDQELQRERLKHCNRLPPPYQIDADRADNPSLLQKVLPYPEKMSHQVTLHLRKDQERDQHEMDRDSGNISMQSIAEHSYAGDPENGTGLARRYLNDPANLLSQDAEMVHRQMGDNGVIPRTGALSPRRNQQNYFNDHPNGSMLENSRQGIDVAFIKQEIDTTSSTAELESHNERLREIANIAIKKEDPYSRMLRPPALSPGRQRSPTMLHESRSLNYNLSPSDHPGTFPPHLDRRMLNMDDHNGAMSDRSHILNNKDRQTLVYSDQDRKETVSSYVPSSTNPHVQYTSSMQTSRNHHPSGSSNFNFDERGDRYTSGSAEHTYFDNILNPRPPEIRLPKEESNNQPPQRAGSPTPVPLLIKNKTYSSLFLDRVLQQQTSSSSNQTDDRFNSDSRSPSALGHRRSDINTSEDLEHGASGVDIDDRLNIATIQSCRNRKRSCPNEDIKTDNREYEKLNRNNLDTGFLDSIERRRQNSNDQPHLSAEGRTNNLLTLPPNSTITNSQNPYLSPNRSSGSMQRLSPLYLQNRHPEVGDPRVSPYSLSDPNHHQLQFRNISPRDRPLSPVDSKADIPLLMESSPEEFKRRILLHCQQNGRLPSSSSLPVLESLSTSRISPNPRSSLNSRISPLPPSPNPKSYQNVKSPLLGHGDESTGVSADLHDQRGPGSVGSGHSDSGISDINGVNKGKRGRPRKHAPKIPLPPLYVFIRNMLLNRSYNPKTVSWVNEASLVFKVNNTAEFARTWGLMKSNRSEDMNYEKMSRAMRYHYGSEKTGRKGHLAMVKEKRLVYRFGELAVNCRSSDVCLTDCQLHDLCKDALCLWTKE